jgi:hypothetical protein
MEIRGLYRFSSLVKQKMKGKICFVIRVLVVYFFYFFHGN